MKNESTKIFSQRRFRGLIYSTLSVIGFGYEIFFAVEIRPILVIGYSIAFLAGIGYFFYFTKHNP